MGEYIPAGDASIDAHTDTSTGGLADAQTGTQADAAEWIDLAAAAGMIGVSTSVFYTYIKAGKLPGGMWVPARGGPGGGRRMYRRETIEAFAMAARAPFPPPGMVDQREATRRLGVSTNTWRTWEAQNRIAIGRYVSVPGKPGQVKLYAIEALERVAAELKESLRQAQAAFPPAGFVRRDEARAIFGAALKTWTDWESKGRITCGKVVPMPGKSGTCKIYPRAELERIKAAWDAEAAAAQQRMEPYPDPERPGVVRVPVCSDLHAGMEALMDAADLPLIAGKQWNWSPGKDPTDRKCGSVVVKMKESPRPSLPRLLLGITDRRQLVTHLNGDRLDCRRENLIVRTSQQVRRAAKRPTAKNGVAFRSRFRGVTPSESGRKWQATIVVNGETHNLGRFRSEIDAALARDAAAREFFGPDAPLNLPDPAEAARLKALEPIVEDGPFPPPGMVDRHEACAMFGISLNAWLAWEKKGRITCGEYHPLPNDKPGRCKLYPKAALERAREEIAKLGKPYPDPDRPGVWRVPLKSYVAHREVLIDEADLPIVEGRNWNWAERTEGRMEGTVVLASTLEQPPLHRMIARVTDPNIRVSFINGDALDCRRENLALRTQAEASHASRKMETRAGKECTSRFKGVYHDIVRERWVAQIRKEKTYLSIGRFHDEIAAAQAYDDCARVWFGPHAYLNFPDRESSEADRIWAQRVLDGTAKKVRQRRRRRKELERKLMHAALERRRAERGQPLAERQATLSAGASPTIGPRMARGLFGASRKLWKRWRRLGWLPACVSVEGKQRYRLDDIATLLMQCGRKVLPYPDPERAGVYRVPLSGDTAKGREALIDADALPLVQTRRWRFAPKETGRGGEVETMNPAEGVRLHYVVMGATSDTALHLAHRNGDPLDCRRENLIWRTLSETGASKRKQVTIGGRPCTSRFKGVWWDKRRERWMATIEKERVQRRLGSYHNEIAAAQAYDEAARELYGEHAWLNFPAGVDARLEQEAREAEQRVVEGAPIPKRAA